MKKVSLFLSVIAMSLLVFTSCEKDIKESIANTKWVWQHDYEYGISASYTIDFVDDANVLFIGEASWYDEETKKMETDQEVFSGTYNYSYPNVELFLNIDEKPEQWSLILKDENTLYWSEGLTFVKQ